VYHLATLNGCLFVDINNSAFLAADSLLSISTL
jgi:hypothetical protein